MRKHISRECICGGEGRTNGVKHLQDGTRKRRLKCTECGLHWTEIIGLEPEEPVQYWGLWMYHRRTWLSPQDQERIRVSCESIP